LFGGYTHDSKLGSTTLSPNMFMYSGTPLTTEANIISTTPGAPYGRGDLGRTPFFTNFDLNLVHDFRPLTSRENIKVRFEFTVFNLFNSSTVTNKNVTLIHPTDDHVQFAHDADVFKGYNIRNLMTAQKARLNPQYGLASDFQDPRTARLQLAFIF
jgi:hypothetical protein